MHDRRNQLILGYASGDLGIVWDTARHGIPKLLRQLKGELAQSPRSLLGNLKAARGAGL